MMATLPSSATNIILLNGVPFTNDYKHTRWFDNITQQSTYFNSLNVVHSMSDATFQRIEGQKFIRVDKSIDELWGVNYLKFQNSAYNNKWFYAFVTKLEYKQTNTTYVHFEIDVIQTWMFDITFKPSYVLREHCQQLDTNNLPVINTIDEGINYGTEYEVVHMEHYVPYNDVLFLVVASKSTMHGTNASTTNNIVSTSNGVYQPLSYYVHPFVASGLLPTIEINGASVNVGSINDFFNYIYSMDKSVNDIASIYITESIGVSLDPNGTGTLNFPQVFEQVTITDSNDNTKSVDTIYLSGDLSSYDTEYHNVCSNLYDYFRTTSESKLHMYPYSMLVIDDFRGNRTQIKPEYISTRGSLDLVVHGSMGVSKKVSYAIENYLNSNLSGVNKDIEAYEKSVIQNKQDDVPIISDYLSAYLQGNRNSLNNQRHQIMFNGIMDNVSSAIGGVASVASLNPIGAVSAVSGMVKGAGNELLQLQGINAKLKDINNMPPQMSQMGDNVEFDYGYDYKGVYILWLQITPEYQKYLEDYFNAFGYKRNEIKIPNFHTRQYWNFVQTSSCVITGNFNTEDLNEIKSVFNNGITLWHTNDVGNYSLTNAVI